MRELAYITDLLTLLVNVNFPTLHVHPIFIEFYHFVGRATCLIRQTEGAHVTRRGGVRVLGASNIIRFLLKGSMRCKPAWWGGGSLLTPSPVVAGR